MRIGFNGSSYTARSTAVADEECINLFVESVESQGAVVPEKAYGGSAAQGTKGMFRTPGLALFSALPKGPVRGDPCLAGGRLFAVGGDTLYELTSAGVYTELGTVGNDGLAASFAVSNTQFLLVSDGRAWCFTLATNALVEVTASLAGAPTRADYSDGYFIVCFSNSNKFQMSDILDGTSWPGIQVNAVSVFPENIRSILVNHRELWVFGERHIQPYQDTGSAEIFDVIPGALIEKGCAATFSPCRVDNSVFWIDEDERGGRSAWRSQGYTPQRISTHAVETDLATYASIAGLTSYAYQDAGHLFWVLYIPGSQWSWTFDVTEGVWHKRCSGWDGENYHAHWSWNHVYAFGKHLVGDWNSGNIYEMAMAKDNGDGTYAFVTDNGTTIRWLRRTPIVSDEMQWIPHSSLIVDFDTGLGPQPPLVDGAGNPRPPQAMLRWSDNRGKTWSNEHIADCGFAGDYTARAKWMRLGRSRYRVYEVSGSDPIPWAIVDAYLNEP